MNPVGMPVEKPAASKVRGRGLQDVEAYKELFWTEEKYKAMRKTYDDEYLPNWKADSKKEADKPKIFNNWWRDEIREEMKTLSAEDRQRLEDLMRTSKEEVQKIKGKLNPVSVSQEASNGVISDKAAAILKAVGMDHAT